jgi:hypothetical protein
MVLFCKLIRSTKKSITDEFYWVSGISCARGIWWGCFGALRQNIPTTTTHHAASQRTIGKIKRRGWFSPSWIFLSNLWWALISQLTPATAVVFHHENIVLRLF